ncbi:MAG: chloride channel protein [Actinomycetes bacterium]
MDPRTVLRSRGYLGLLLLAAVLGVPISAIAYGFLALVDVLQDAVFTDLPRSLGLGKDPDWWPLPWLALAGLLVGLTLRYLPGTGGHPPSEGFHASGPPSALELPGVVLAAVTSLALGVVLGPEAPLIALGAGLAALAVRSLRRDVPARTVSVVASSGSFAAISTLLGSPLLGAFLLMEASGLGGATLGLVLLPGLLSAGVGSLIFVGLDAWTGLGTYSLAIPGLPAYGGPDVAEFGWALVIGLAAAVFGTGIRWLGQEVRPRVEPRMVLLTPVAGLAVAGLAFGYAALTDRSTSEVLFSGQDAVGPLVSGTADYTAGALVLLLMCKGLAYAVSLGSFRGGPVFPSMLLGAAGGLALSHLPGLNPVAGTAMGIGAMAAVMLQLPLTSVLLATLLLGKDGLDVMPLVIVAVVVAYLAAARLAPKPAPAGAPTGATTGPPTQPRPRGPGEHAAGGQVTRKG